MYDPMDFSHGIDVLADAAELGNPSHRASILDIMLVDLDGIGGNIADDLARYVADLAMFPDDPADFDKLRRLHHELACNWGSSTDYERIKQEPVVSEYWQVIADRTESAKAGADKNAELALLRREAIAAWVDQYLDQRISSDPASSRDLATRLLKTNSGMIWPGGKALGDKRVAAHISAHLKEKYPS